MCGITGFIRTRDTSPADPAILARMTQAIAHRGPDDEGFWSSDGAWLGHRRLSIIDVAGGHQPIANEDGRVVVVLNGEIYNHHELRQDLQSRGHVFSTRSDTEVLVHLWEDEREAMLSHLEGMFAIALWDARDRTLLLARDRMGKKPLFYGLFDGDLVFGSELRSMMAHPAVPRRVDPDALYRYLTLDYVPAPRSILAGVRKVMPGGYAIFHDGEVQEGHWFDLRPTWQNFRVTKPPEAAAMLWSTLRQEVQRRLESEVPLGVFLSGGLDSTAVLAAMAEGRDPATIDTFTIGFEDPSYDESGPARAVADAIGTRHHQHILSMDSAASLVRGVVSIADEPLADPSLLPTYLLARFARQHVTVALSGDGGDELFYGYPTFRVDGAARFLARWLPGKARSDWLPRAVDLVPKSDRDMSLDFRLARFVRGLKYGSIDRHFAWIGGFDPGLALGVMSPDLLAARNDGSDEPYPDVSAWRLRAGGGDDLATIACVYARLYLGDGVLSKVDRATMAVGLETRAPLLDSDMVGLALSMSPALSLSGHTTKALMRLMLRGKVPEPILARPKKGFGIPMANWLRTGLRPLLEEHLAPSKIAREGFFRPEVVSGLLASHLSGAANVRKELYSLLVFELWLSRYLL
jgi:asparagine synthase (glutamine-hydrolysing)